MRGRRCGPVKRSERELIDFLLPDDRSRADAGVLARERPFCAPLPVPALVPGGGPEPAVAKPVVEGLGVVDDAVGAMELLPWIDGLSVLDDRATEPAEGLVGVHGSGQDRAEGGERGPVEGVSGPVDRADHVALGVGSKPRTVCSWCVQVSTAWTTPHAVFFQGLTRAS